MKVQELSNILQQAIEQRHGDDGVMIRRQDPSVGPVAMTGVKSAGVGIDWENGYFLLFPIEGLHIQNDERVVKQYRDEAERLAFENQRLRRDLERLNQENQKLQRDLEQLQGVRFK